MSHRAATIVRMGETNLIYFWDDKKYCIIHGSPEDYGDLVIVDPRTWDDWKTLSRRNLDHVDAILPPKSPKFPAWYIFFQGFSHISVNIADDRIGAFSDTPSGNWYHLEFGSRKKIHADGISGAIPIPGTENEAWIFGGTQMARINYKNDEKLEVLSNPYYIAEQWSNLGWDTIDMIFPVPGADGQAYVFSGNKAARVIVPSEGNVQLVGDVKPVGQYWSSLKRVGFYE